METTFIYALCEPGTQTVRYIGKSDNPKKRLRKHLRDSSGYASHLGRWIKKVLSFGKTPELVVLREVPFEQWAAAEERYIRLARGCGMDLVNATDGGEGLKNPSSETLEKLRKAATGVEKSPETLEKMSLLWSGEKNPNFGKTGEAHPRFGVKHTETACASISDSKKGEKNPQFGRTGEKSPRFGVLHSEESCNRMSARKIGVNNPNFGRVYTASEKAKLSASLKASWAARKAAKI